MLKNERKNMIPLSILFFYSFNSKGGIFLMACIASTINGTSKTSIAPLTNPSGAA
jgi:hypothetical protein